MSTLSQCKAHLVSVARQSAAAEIPSSSTPTFDTPSSSTPALSIVTLTSIAAQLSYLVDKVNVLLERTETIESDVLQMRTDATRNRADMKHLRTDVAWIKKYLEEAVDDIDALPSTAPPFTAGVEESGSYRSTGASGSGSGSERG